jgi:outer membrane protein assembly factor BamB
VGDKVFITSWGGDNGIYVLESNRYTNNKILAVDLQNPKRTWQEELSAPSFSSPAVSLSHDIVIAGCNSPNNDSVFAFSLNGSKLWSKKIGAIGYASPVIYDNTVFVTATITSSLSIKTMMYALNLTDGKILWNKTICSSDKAYSSNGDSTPAIFDNILYVASPNGTLFALNASGGSELWATSVYNRSHLFSKKEIGILAQNFRELNLLPFLIHLDEILYFESHFQYQSNQYIYIFWNPRKLFFLFYQQIQNIHYSLLL